MAIYPTRDSIPVTVAQLEFFELILCDQAQGYLQAVTADAAPVKLARFRCTRTL